MDYSSSIKWLHAVRKYELDFILQYLPNDKNIKLLELGSGTGYQLSILNKIYKNSTGVELNSSEKASSQYPVLFDNIIEYDGKILPFENNSFDVIISSHVMEHIDDIANYDKEIKRVLKGTGIVVHVLPSHIWRIWTSIWHYPLGFLLAFQIFKGLFIKSNDEPISKNKLTKRKIMKNIFFSETHGIRGNPLSEIYYFTPLFWKKLFTKYNWDLIEVRGMGLLYWGRDFFQFKISIKSRKILSKIFGSSSTMFILKK